MTQLTIKIRTMKKFYTLLFILLSLISFSQTTKWEVLPENAKKPNPVGINYKSLSIGKNIVTKSCVACHGSKLDGKGLMQSANLLSDTFQLQTDGAIYTKIFEGRNKMPPFKGMFKDDEIWSVVNYLRALVNPSLIPPPKDVKMDLILNDEIKSITAFVYTNIDTAKIPVKDVDVHFYVKREFGLMSIGETSNFTKENGKVSVSLPDKVIGDNQGNVTIYVKIENSIEFKNVVKTINQKWGIPLKIDESWFDKRSLWGTNDKIPIWLLMIISGVLITVFSCIGYVINSIYKIKKESEIFLN